MEMEEKPKWTNRTKGFFKEVEIEMKKVTWPTRGELYGSTSVVVFVTMVMSILLGLADAGLGKVVQLLLAL